MDSLDTEFLLQIADNDMEGYELLSLISHMSTYAHGCLNSTQQKLVDEIEQVLTFIYVRDKLDDAKNERLADMNPSGDEDGTHTDD